MTIKPLRVIGVSAGLSLIVLPFVAFLTLVTG